jgi:hypothetical protein
MDKLNFHKQKRGVTASTGSADLNQVQAHAEAAVNNAVKDIFPVPACLSAGDMAVTSNGNWTVHVSAGVGYDEYGQRVNHVAAEDIDYGPTAYANPAAGNEYYLRIVAVYDVTETDPRVDGDGIAYNFHQADGCTIEARKGVEAVIGAAAVPAAEAGDITLAVIRRFAGQANIAVGDISVTLRDELAQFVRLGDSPTLDDVNVLDDLDVGDDAAIHGDLTVDGALHATADDATHATAADTATTGPAASLGFPYYLQEPGVFNNTLTFSSDIPWVNYSIGPTGSGADRIWTAMDAIPDGAKAVLLNFRAIAEHGAGVAGVNGVLLNVYDPPGGVDIVDVVKAFANLPDEVAYNNNSAIVRLDNNRCFWANASRQIVAGGTASVEIRIQAYFI